MKTLTVSEEKFRAFVEVQMSGKTNMFDVDAVIRLSDGVLTKGDCIAIMENYDVLEKAYPEGA